MKSKLQEKKKKDREKRVRLKLDKKREEVRKQKKYEEKIKADVMANAPKQKPFSHAEELKVRLEHNIEILKALEDQYIAELEEKKRVNKELEADGHLTAEEKMEALKTKTQEIADHLNCKIKEFSSDELVDNQ